MGQFVDLTGKRFHRLIVAQRVPRPHSNRTKGVYWLCRCDCGGSTVTTTNCLKSGNTRSCGCYKREHAAAAAKRANTKHGHSKKHPLWMTWIGIRSRCHNPRATGYKHWGGRGITICDRWRDFTTFIADVGERPSPDHSLDRIDKDGHYEPGNVRWATHEEQANNRRDNLMVHYRGTEMTLRRAWRAAGCIVSRESAVRRVANGWPVEAALTIPAMVDEVAQLRTALQSLWAHIQNEKPLGPADKALVQRLLSQIAMCDRLGISALQLGRLRTSGTKDRWPTTPSAPAH